MQKRLCRRPEIFNDESIHYRIRSLCFCCHEMYTFIISVPSAECIVPLLRTTLKGKYIKRKNNKRTQIQTQTQRKHAYQCTHQHPQGQQTYTPWNILLNPAHFLTSFIKPAEWCFFSFGVLFSCFISVPETEPDIWACNETFYANCICLWAN